MNAFQKGIDGSLKRDYYQYFHLLITEDSTLQIPRLLLLLETMKLFQNYLKDHNYSSGNFLTISEYFLICVSNNGEFISVIMMIQFEILNLRAFVSFFLLYEI
jgi:hypothetical protein